MVNPAETSVTIVGAGIVGLTAALELHSAGFHQVKIFERVRELQPLGVGISIHEGASLVLRNLGLLPAMKHLSPAARSLSFNDRWGNHVCDFKMGSANGSQLESYMIHRGNLQMMLADAVRERLGVDSIHPNHSLSGFEERETKIVARFTDHDGGPATIAEYESDMLLGADGVNSNVRSLLYPEESGPLFAGLSIYRGALWTSQHMDGHTISWHGHSDQMLLAYPISRLNKEGKQLLNWVCVLRTRAKDDPNKQPPDIVSWDATAPKADLKEPFNGWKTGGLQVQDIINDTDKVWIYPMVDKDPLQRWSFGRLTLIGDAAHPMYPNGGNGATQGIIDTEALVKHLCAAQDVASGLKAYEADRLPATSKIVLANRGEGGIHSVGNLVHERAPNGFDNLDDVISKEEIEKIGEDYEKATGNATEIVNGRAEETKGTAERLGLHSPKGWS